MDPVLNHVSVSPPSPIIIRLTCPYVADTESLSLRVVHPLTVPISGALLSVEIPPYVGNICSVVSLLVMSSGFSVPSADQSTPVYSLVLIYILQLLFNQASRWNYGRILLYPFLLRTLLLAVFRTLYPYLEDDVQMCRFLQQKCRLYTTYNKLCPALRRV